MYFNNFKDTINNDQYNKKIDIDVSKILKGKEEITLDEFNLLFLRGSEFAAQR